LREPAASLVPERSYAAGPTAPAAAPPRRRLSLAPSGGWPQGARLGLAAIGFAIYVGSIAGANWMISHVGRPVAGAHVLPVGFGLEAPSGVYLAGLTFVARDIVQRLAGLRVGVVAIVIGATLSWWLSSPAIAVASGVTFLLSESCDFLVYTPLQTRHFPYAVVGSGLVADVVDSVVFLTLAGIPLAVALPGQLVGKAWVVLIGGVVAGFLRRYGPFKKPA
jgi:queuosine precursor transporter